ncbi:MAG: hypothetical protein ACRCZF_25110 [Gemmataceae bacterium]
MRGVSLVLSFWMTATATAQNGQQVGIVVSDDVVVRGAPRPDGPDTGILLRKSSVIVHHTEGDHYYAIQAPPNSVSWVNHLFIKPTRENGTTFPQNWSVAADGAIRLAVGRPGTNRPLEVRQTTIPDGTILIVTGPKVDSPEDSTKWYPIVPPEDDFRYVPKDAIRLEGPFRSSFIVRSGEPLSGNRTEPSVASLPNPSARLGTAAPSLLGGSAPKSSNALWQQAERAEQAGDFDLAEKLYFQLAREMNGPGGDADLVNQCYTRIHSIRERRRNGATSRSTNPQTADKTTWDPPGRNSEVPRIDPPATNRDGDRRNRPDDRPQWTGSGTLRRTSITVDGGRQVFALENARNQVLFYAVAEAGVDLNRYERKSVDLFGVHVSITDLRVPLVKVTQVEAIR